MMKTVPDTIIRESPHFDERPDGRAHLPPRLHNISLPPGEFGGDWIDDLFMGRLDPAAHPYFRDIAGLKVSAHYLIRRDGTLIQYVDPAKRAWHAGVSSWNGVERCNDFSIGVELEGADDVPFAEPQYETLVALAKPLRAIRRARCRGPQRHRAGSQDRSRSLVRLGKIPRRARVIRTAQIFSKNPL
jgi:N-acetyl-anhydromuramyl-L-alanine amidase AmpD